MAWIPKAERLRRHRMIKTGEWDDMWVTLADSRRFFASKSELTAGGRVEFRDMDGVMIAICDLADVVKAVH